MKKRIISIVMAFLTALIMFPQATFASSAADLKAAYEASLEQYSAAVANVELAQQGYDTISALVAEEYNALKANYGYTDADLAATEASYNQALSQKTELEANLETARAALTEAQTDYQTMWATLEDGAFSFYPWVKENYPEYAEDIDLAMELLDEGIADGYINRGDFDDSTSIYCMKYSLQVMKQYVALKTYFQDDESMSAMFHYNNAHMTSFSLMAHAQHNAGHSAVQYGHDNDYLKKYRLSENLLIGPIKNQSGTEWSFYDGKLTHTTQPLLVTAPTTGYEQTFNEWLTEWLSAYPTVYEDLPWLFETYNPFYRWFVKEKYYFDNGETNVDMFAHYVNVIYKGPSAVAVSLGEKSGNDRYATVAHNFDTDETLLTVEEFERMLDEYVESIGFVACTNALTEAQADVTAKEGLLTKQNQLITYLEDALNAQASLAELTQAQEALAVAEANMQQAKAAYAAYVPFEVENVVAQNSLGYVDISWNPSTARATTYSIYRKTGSEDWTFLSKQLGTKYMDTRVESGNTYDYCIVATNRYGHSELVEQTTITYLATPQLLYTPMFSQYYNIMNPKLEWEAVPGATGYDVYQKNGKTTTLVRHLTGTELWIYGSDYPLANTGENLLTVPVNTQLQLYVVATTDTDESFPSTMESVYVPSRTMCTVIFKNKTYEVQKFGYVLDTETGETLRGVPITAVGKVTIRWKPQSGITQYDVWRISRTGAKKYLGCVTGTRMTNAVTANQNYYYFAVPRTQGTAILFD